MKHNDVANSYYYIHGWYEDRPRLSSDRDCVAFLNLLRRGLGHKIDLVSYCLLPNHFHLLLYQKEELAIKSFLKPLGAKYKASRVDYQRHVEEITRDIHLKPEDWRRHKYSSLLFYMGEERAGWLKHQHVTRYFSGRQDYLMFLKDGGLGGGRGVGGF